MLPNRIFSTFQTASQGMAVQREKITVASRNIANANTSAEAGSGKPYKPQSVQAMGPSHETFKNVFTNSISRLNTTNEKHFSTPAAHDSGQIKQNGMGPEFQVTESDNFRFEFDPNHPDADENGMVKYPDVDLVREMTQLISANRMYEANLSSVQAEKEIIRKSLEI